MITDTVAESFGVLWPSADSESNHNALASSFADWMHCRHGRAPHAYIPLAQSYFASDQNYDIVLELDVPISPDNIRLGQSHFRIATVLSRISMG